MATTATAIETKKTTMMKNKTTKTQAHKNERKSRAEQKEASKNIITYLYISVIAHTNTLESLLKTQ